MPKQIFIHDDGQGHVSILDEDGQILPGVYFVQYSSGVNEGSRITLHCHGPVTNVKSEVVEVRFTCPVCTFVNNHRCGQESDDNSNSNTL